MSHRIYLNTVDFALQPIIARKLINGLTLDSFKHVQTARNSVIGFQFDFFVGLVHFLFFGRDEGLNVLFEFVKDVFEGGIDGAKMCRNEFFGFFCDHKFSELFSILLSEFTEEVGIAASCESISHICVLSKLMCIITKSSVSIKDIYSFVNHSILTDSSNLTFNLIQYNS